MAIMIIVAAINNLRMKLSPSQVGKWIAFSQPPCSCAMGIGDRLAILAVIFEQKNLVPPIWPILTLLRFAQGFGSETGSSFDLGQQFSERHCPTTLVARKWDEASCPVKWEAAQFLQPRISGGDAPWRNNMTTTKGRTKTPRDTSPQASTSPNR